MSIINKFACFILLLVACFSINSYAASDQEWVVVLKDPRPARLQGWQRNHYFAGGSDYNDSLELKKMSRRISRQFNMTLKQEWFIETLQVYCLIVQFNDNEQQTLEKLQKDQRVKWVQISNDFKLMSQKSTDNNVIKKLNNEVTLPDRPKLPVDLNGEGVSIAIIDSAVDTLHQDLSSAIYKSTDFVIAADNAEYTGEAHGTAIAGILVANDQNELGIAGLSPAAKLYAYRGCWEQSSGQTRCNTLSLARALDAVARSNTNILNLSLSGPKDRLLDQLIKRVISNGTFVVAAFDSSRTSAQRFPSDNQHILFVRAEMSDQKFDSIFTAPGSRMVLAPNNRYKFATGHSIATAYTSGILALYKQAITRSEKAVDWRSIAKFSTANELIQELVLYSSKKNLH